MTGVSSAGTPRVTTGVGVPLTGAVVPFACVATGWPHGPTRPGLSCATPTPLNWPALGVVLLWVMQPLRAASMVIAPAVRFIIFSLTVVASDGASPRGGGRL